MLRSRSLALVIGLTGLVLLLRAPAASGSDSSGGEAPPSFSLFQPPQRPPIPTIRHTDWVVNPIDGFVLARLEAQGLTPSAPADKLRLLRRVTVDLTGLPPTLDEQEAFLADHSPDAYGRVVERLLASPQYGERWAEHWLDLVRYAESDGFKADELRPAAHRYRDWVIRALNADLPYDRFVRQQLAGDELEPGNPEALVATGLNRLWPDEYNAANLEQRRQEILEDLTDTTGYVFLGLSVACARCHDHKFDPISQKDYYRLQAFFAPMRPRDDLPAVDASAREDYRARLARWEAATRTIRAEMEKLVANQREKLRGYALQKFRREIQEAVRTPPDRRTPYQMQIALMAEKQMDRAAEEAPARLPPDKQKRYRELERQLARTPGRPAPLPPAMAITDVGSEGPPTYRLMGGDWRKPRQRLEAGFPHFLGPARLETALPPGVVSTGRRAALARWLTRRDHPLTARVMVNRLWQHHFGQGLVATPNDFGSQGDRPTHPELLDWLAVEFVEHGWSLKHLHRLMVTSAAYRQDSRVDPNNSKQARALREDSNNHLLWHARRRRLEGEALRDAMLALSGELNRRPFGRSARPPLPEGISKYAWKPDARPQDQNRRSVYVLAQRNMRFPLFDAFDLPDMHNSCARRLNTTTAPQALLLLNGDFTRARAAKLAEVLRTHFPEEGILVARAYRAAWGRPATAEEIALGLRFLKTQAEVLRRGVDGRGSAPEAARAEAVVDFCHALFNSNEFLYVD